MKNCIEYKLGTLKFKIDNSSLDIHEEGVGMMIEYKSIGILSYRVLKNLKSLYCKMSYYEEGSGKCTSDCLTLV